MLQQRSPRIGSGADGHNIVDGKHDQGPMESKGDHNETEYRPENNAAKDGAELIDRQHCSRKQRARLLNNGADHKERDGGGNSNRQERDERKCHSIERTARSHLLRTDANQAATIAGNTVEE